MLWVPCRNTGAVNALTDEQEIGWGVDEFLDAPLTKPVRSVGGDLENNVNSFSVGNLLVGRCSASAISSVTANKEVQGNKLRVERK